MSADLTLEEARQRAALVRVDSYQVDLDLTSAAGTFASSSLIRFSSRAPDATTFVNLTAAGVHRITLNGEPVDPAAFDGHRIALTGLCAENVLAVDAECEYSRTGAGLHKFIDPADGRAYLYSDLEAFDAHRVYACFDQPDLKASFAFTVTAPADWTVVSNMAPDLTEPVQDGICWRFPATPPMPTYITAVAAGPYHLAKDECDGIPLGIFCRQSLAEYLDPDEIFTITKQGFGFFHNIFGTKYPFGKYDQLFVPEFKEGAMENPGAVTFTEQFLFRSRVTDFVRQGRAETILHEMAHMWFGDLVTMRWWDDLWLNESFATWAGTLAEVEATRWSSGWTTFAQLYKAWAYRQDQLATTHPISADIPDIAAVEVNFDGITYAKGAAVLKQLVAWVGRENFLVGVRRYFAAHAWGNATLADLLSALEAASGRELTSWSRQWLETAGVNTLRPSFTLDEADRFTSFAVLQEAPQQHPVLRSHRIAIGLYNRSCGALARTGRVEVDVAGELTMLPAMIGESCPDLLLVNDDDLSYAKIRLDQRSLRTLLGNIGGFADSLPAALCWSAAWDMCRDGEMAAREYVKLVASGVGTVPDVSMAQALLGQAGVAVRRYADPAWQETGLELIATTLRGLLSQAPAGSDTQLTYLRALAEVATRDDDLAFLAGLLDCSAALRGLLVDTDLRWTLLTRLVSRGKAGASQIDRERSRDATDAGERHAATCHAAIPAADAKRAAWRKLTSGELPLALFRALLAGFAYPDQRALTEPYLDDYFSAIDVVWRTWPTAMAQDFVAGLYPACPFSQQTVDATDAYIATTDPPAALRRLLTEGQDDILRTLRCRALNIEGAISDAGL